MAHDYGCPDCRRMSCVCHIREEKTFDVFDTEIRKDEIYWMDRQTGEIVADVNLYEHAAEAYYTKKTR